MTSFSSARRLGNDKIGDADILSYALRNNVHKARLCKERSLIIETQYLKKPQKTKLSKQTANGMFKSFSSSVFFDVPSKSEMASQLKQRMLNNQFFYPCSTGNAPIEAISVVS